nr:hypothetical protein CFP56_15037 [Quercus suber]
MGHANDRSVGDFSKPKPSYRSSVKDKKVIARLRASQSKMESAVGESSSDFHQAAIIPHEIVSNHGGQDAGSSSQVQFTTDQEDEVGFAFRGNTSVVARAGLPNPCSELGQRGDSETMEVETSFGGVEHKGGRVSTDVGYGENPMESLEKQTHCVVHSGAPFDGCARCAWGVTGEGVGVVSVKPDLVVGRGTGEGYVEMERMDLEGEGDAATIC